MIVNVLLPLILAIIMFTLGLGLRGRDFTRVIQFPRAFFVGLGNQLLLLPLFGYGLIRLFGIEGDLAVGMMILCFCPGGVTTNVMSQFAGGNVPLSVSMTAVTSLLSILTVPLMVGWSLLHFTGEAEAFSITALGIKMFLLTAIPVLLGMLLTAKAPGVVERRGKLFSRVALGLFVFIILAAIAKNREVVLDNLPTLGPALVLMNIGLLAAGMLSARLFRLQHRDASTIAIESGVQNGALGIAVGALIAVGVTEILPPTTVPSAVYGILMNVISIPFVCWQRKVNLHRTATEAAIPLDVSGLPGVQAPAQQELDT